MTAAQPVALAVVSFELFLTCSASFFVVLASLGNSSVFELRTEQAVIVAFLK
jgi:hypothetical protein